MNRYLLFGLLVLGCSSGLLAQPPSGLGVAPFGAYFKADIDSVNLYNGNVLADIPLFFLTGREAGTGLRLTYNSQGWQEGSTPFGSYGFYMGGWKIANPVGGIGIEPYLIFCDTSAPEPIPPTGYWAFYVFWRDETGGLHTYEAPGPFVAGPQDGGCASFPTFGGEIWMTSTNAETDGSIAYFGPDGLRIHLPDGTIIEGSRLRTRNGNYMDQSFYGEILDDMLGRSIDASWNAGPPGFHYWEFKVRDTTGTQQSYKLHFKDCLTVYNPITLASECISVLQSIQLPKEPNEPEKVYVFEYGHTQGFLTRITLPTGGYIAFDYYGGNGNHNADQNYVVKKRVSSNGSPNSEVEWNFERTQSGGIRTQTVTDPEGHQVKHTFDALGYETMTEWRNTPTASPSKIVLTTRTPGGLPSTVTTQMETLQHRQTFSWAAYARISESTQSDWYPIGGTVAPLTKTTYTYDIGCAGTNPCNFVFPSQIELMKWNANQYVTQGKTKFFYDQYSLSSTSFVTHYQPPTLARWNLTTVRRYRDASNYVEEHFHYDNLGNIVSHTDPRGKVTSIAFSSTYAHAFPTRLTNAKGHQTDTAYNFNTGLPVSILDARHQATTFTYDLMGRPKKITEPNGRETNYAYDDVTPKVEERTKVAATGIERKIETTLDKLNQPIQIKLFDPAGNVFVDTQYYGNGLVKKISTPYRGSSPTAWTETTYDVLGRPLTVTNPDSTTVGLAYQDNKVTTTDETGKQRRQTWNALEQLSKVEEPDPTLSTALETTYSYYVFGPLAQVTQGGQTRTFTVDWLGRTTQESHPEDETTSYTYDDVGLLMSRTDSRNILTTYSYDDIGRPLTITYHEATPDVVYTYDAGGFTGFLTGVDTDGVTSSAFEYNVAGQLSKETVTFSGVNGTFVTQYGYDLDGRLLTTTYPSGRVLTRTYDAASGFTSNRLSTLVDAPTSTSLIGSVTDNASGQIMSRRLGGVIDESRNFNPRLQLTGIGATAGSTTLMDLDYGYGSTNNTGRIVNRTDGVQPEHSVNYGYDAIGRLKAISAANSSWGIDWVLDRYGNRTAQTPSGLAIGRVGSPSQAYMNNKSTSYTYVAGNLTNDTTHTYFYDAENRLKQVDSGSIQYAYDSGGRRVRKTVGSVSTFYLYGLTGLMSEFSTDSTLSTKNAAGSNDRLEYRISDPTGTAVLLMAPDGTVRSNNRVFPFGEPWQIPTGSSNTQEFTNYQRDSESGLDYAMARHYASRSGRFMTPDPMHLGAFPEDPQSWNAYVYSRNDPTNLIDPTGMTYQICPWSVGCSGGFELTDEGFERFVSIGGYHMQGNSLYLNTNDDLKPLYFFFQTKIDRNDRATQLIGELGKRADASMQLLGVASGGSVIVGSAAALAPVAGTAILRTGAKAIGRTVAASGGSGIVLGAYPEYIEAAERIGANKFSISQPIWDFLNYFGQAWTANQAFIDGALVRGQQVYLSTAPLLKVGEAPTYQRELQYLIVKGVDATQWIILHK